MTSEFMERIRMIFVVGVCSSLVCVPGLVIRLGISVA